MEEVQWESAHWRVQSWPLESLHVCKCMSSFGLGTRSPSQRLREGLGMRIWKRPGELETG